VKLYELTYLVPTTLSEEEVSAFNQKISEIITKEGGETKGEIFVARKRLVFPIKKQTQAYMAVLTFVLSPEKLASVVTSVKADSQILRHIMVAKQVRTRKPKVRVRLPKPGDKAQTPEQTIGQGPTGTAKKETKEDKKVEIEDIEKKLAEILGEI